MYTIQSVPSSSHPQPVEEIPLQDLAAPDTGISDGDDRSNPLNEAPVLAACRNNNRFWLRYLLAENKELAYQEALSGATGHSVSPLHITAQGGFREATECLMDTALLGVPDAEKANVAIKLMTFRHSNGETPLFLAAQNAHEFVVLTFLNYLRALPEADIARALVTVMNAARYDGQTPLGKAIARGDDRMVYCFLEALKNSPRAQRADVMIEVLAPDKQSEGKVLPLHLAASMGNSRIVNLLLESVSAVPESDRSRVARRVVNATDAHGATPLLIAVRGGFPRIVEHILLMPVISEVPASERAEVGNALVNTANKNGATPLLAAAAVKDWSIVALLLEHGADLEQAKVRCAPRTYRRSPPHQMSPVLAACHNNDLPSLRKLLANDPDQAQRAEPSDATDYPFFPLHITAREGHKEATECLMGTALQGVPEAEKANVAITLLTPRLKNGETPFYLAVRNAHEFVVLTFLNYLLALPQADIARALVAVMNAARKDGQTPLCKAIKRGDDQVVSCFLQALKCVPLTTRADTMIQVLAPGKQGKGERQPLHLAARMGNGRIINLLLESVSAVPSSDISKVARQVVNATDAHGATPLLIAARGGYPRIVQQILAIISKVPESERAEVGNVLVNTANKVGATPLYAAASSQDRSIVAMLLEHGADLEQSKVRCTPGIYRRSNTPRQVADQHGCKSIVALIDKAIQSRKAASLPSEKGTAAAVSSAEVLSATDLPV